MEKTKRWIKNNLLFFISLIFLTISLIFSLVILQEFRIQSNMESTRVGHIYLGSEDNSYPSNLNQGINEFLSESEYRIFYQNQIYELDLNYFTFNLDSTIDSLEPNQNNLAIFSLSLQDQTLLENDLKSAFSENVFNNIEFNALIDAISNKLSNLTYFYNFNLLDFFEINNDTQVLVSSTYTINDNTIITDIGQLESFMIPGNSYFSFLESAETYNFSNESLSFIASCILNISLETHFNNFSYNKYDESVSWPDYGFNVRILKANSFDLNFYNSFENTYEIVFTVMNSNTVKIELLGLPFINEYSYDIIIQPVPFNTIYVSDSDLTDVSYKVSESDEEIVYQKELSAGVDGEIHQFIRTITTPNSTEIEITIINDLKAPTPRFVAENIVPKAGG